MVASLSREELIAWAAESVAFYGLDLSRLSTVLLAQAYSFEINRTFSTFDLTQPIKVLEGLSSSSATGREDQFQHAPLTGLYKKHFTSPRFLPRNLLNFLRSKEGGRHFNEAWDTAAQASGSQYIDDAFTKYLSHHMVVDSIEIKNSSNRMTGESVVFHKHEGKNYYLTFGLHSETNDEIYKRIVLACEFDSLPFKL
ncbi:hypothetical protein [Burkholderia sp. Ac-20365]|jgi:hypothetical protein|uniref:hypothetical protein n=1 Tax=Burkholderia sp. Ac-20365 TaxID=2703897 RepID=UPI00197CB348|nr:hypothetical protein [Burkholderia sp. Ac-20365]MBN3762200.1 hypothetical protein [Burkholderia sp. Ac-20365]